LIARQLITKSLSFGGIQMQGLHLPDKVDICAAFSGEFDISDIFDIHDDVWLQSEQFEVIPHCTALLKQSMDQIQCWIKCVPAAEYPKRDC